MVTDRQVSPSATSDQLNSPTRILHDRSMATGDQTRFGGILAVVQRSRIRNFFAVRHRDSKSFSPVGCTKVAARQSVVFLSVRNARIAVTLLQLYNAVLLNAFWPFLTAIVVQLIAAMFQFARLILRPPEEQ